MKTQTYSFFNQQHHLEFDPQIGDKIVDLKINGNLIANGHFQTHFFIFVFAFGNNKYAITLRKVWGTQKADYMKVFSSRHRSQFKNTSFQELCGNFDPHFLLIIDNYTGNQDSLLRVISQFFTIGKVDEESWRPLNS